MPDRIIRDELLDSDRWLGLPNDTDRLAFVGLVLRVDDFGNIEGGPRRLFRFLHGFTQIKTEEGAATVLLHLSEADMLRRYESAGREFFHLPRLRPHSWYLVRKCPPSPWDDPTLIPGKTVRRVSNQGLAKNLSVTSQSIDENLPQSAAENVEMAFVHGQYTDQKTRSLKYQQPTKKIAQGVVVEVEVVEKQKQTTLFDSPAKAPANTNRSQHRETAIDILARLNRLTGRNFRPVPANLDPIVARLAEGYTGRDLRIVVARKCREWNNDEAMQKFARPKTLFNRTNFANYAGEVPPNGPIDDANPQP